MFFKLFTSLYKEIGFKIKVFAIFVAICGVIASVIIGLYFIKAGGILVILLGPIVSWVLSFFTYGFGQIVESIQNIEQKITEDKN